MSQGNMGMGMGSQGMGSHGGMPQPTSMGAGPMGGMSGAAGPSPVIYSGQPTGPNVQPSGRPLFPSGGPQIQDSYQDRPPMNDGYSATMPQPVPSTSSGYGGRGVEMGMLDGRGGMPDVRGGMPERHGGMPDVRGGMPDVRGGMPDVRGHGGIPDPPQISSARSFDWGHGMPDGRGGMPDGRGGMPDGRGGMPDVRGSMSVSPQMTSARSLDTIIISNLPLDCDWQVLKKGFSHCGDIQFAEMKGPGSLLIRFGNETDAARAISMMHKQTVAGRVIDVRPY